MKKILTSLFATVLVLVLCTAVLTVGVTAADKTSEQTPAPVSASTTEQETEMTFGDRLSQAGMVTLEGMCMIFAVLALLWGVLELFRTVMQRSAKKKAEKTAVKAEPDQVSTTAGSENTEPQVADEVTDDEGTVAAITAAVAAYLASEGDAAYAGGFRVVSFKRSGNGSAWNKK